MTSVAVRTTIAPTAPSNGTDVDDHGAHPAAPRQAVTSRRVLDVLREAFAVELDGHRVPDDELLAWLHDNHNVRFDTR